jgi:hypothetical protein
MKALASLIGSFAALLVPSPGNEEKLVQWIAGARASDLPNLHSFTRGLDLDVKAASAALTLPHHNGRTEGVNCKTKMLKRQMYGRAGFDLLPHPPRIRPPIVTTETATEPSIKQAHADAAHWVHARVEDVSAPGRTPGWGISPRTTTRSTRPGSTPP